MINLHTYIFEKLHLDKNLKASDDKNYIVDDIVDKIHKSFIHFMVSRKDYDVSLINDKKYIVDKPEDTWYVEIEFYTNDQKQVNTISKYIQIKLEDLIPEKNVNYYEIYKGKYVIKIYLYDPE